LERLRDVPRGSRGLRSELWRSRAPSGGGIQQHRTIEIHGDFLEILDPKATVQRQMAQRSHTVRVDFEALDIFAHRSDCRCSHNVSARGFKVNADRMTSLRHRSEEHTSELQSLAY